MQIIIDYFDKHSGSAIVVAIVLAFFGWTIEYVSNKRKGYRLKRNLLEAIRLELDFNSNWIKDLIPQQADAERYYDVTRANFRLRDDAVNYAITNGQSILLSEPELLKILIRVSHAVRYVNQQIEEQMLTRFSSPEFSSRITQMQENNPTIKQKWMNDRNLIPEEFRAFMSELHLRHLAINNFGFWGQLKPALEESKPKIDHLIEMIDTNKKWWHFWKG